MNDAPKNSAEAARDVLDRHIKALNARDEVALAATMHFPHYRLSRGVVTVWETPDTYFADFRKRAGGDWHHTTWDEINYLDGNDTKVHFDVHVTRRREDDSPIVSFRSMWAVSHLNGVWGAHLRSSFEI